MSLPPVDWNGIVNGSTRLAVSEPLRDEVEAGVRVERRSFIRLGLGLGACAGMSGTSSACTALGEEPATPRRLDFDAFLRRLTERAARAVRDEPENEDAYLFEIASWLTRVEHVPALEYTPFPGLEGVLTARHKRELPVSVLDLRLEPGAVIPCHNHNGYAGNLLGLEGEVTIESFDPVSGKATPVSGETMRVRRTGTQLLQPGRVATLSTTRDNLHRLVAGPKGARALDIFTFFTQPGPSSYLELASEPRDPAWDIQDGTWI